MPNFPYYMVFHEVAPPKACPHCNGSLGGGVTKSYSYSTLAAAIEARNDDVRFRRGEGDVNPDIPYVWRADSYGQLTRLDYKDDPSRCR